MTTYKIYQCLDGGTTIIDPDLVAVKILAIKRKGQLWPATNGSAFNSFVKYQSLLGKLTFAIPFQGVPDSNAANDLGLLEPVYVLYKN